MRAVKRAAGFTLLEVLLALGIGALVLVAAFGGLQLGMRAWSAGAAEGERLELQQAVLDWIPRQVAAARPLPLETIRGQQARAVFDGRPDGFTFVAPLAAHLGPPGLRRISLDAAMGDDNRLHLLLEYPLWGQRDGLVAEHERRVLTEQPLTGARFGYFGRKARDGVSGWHADWRELPFLPRAIRIELAHAGVPADARGTTLWIPLHADGGLLPAWAETRQ
jgi:general secretion pathway protein J